MTKLNPIKVDTDNLVPVYRHYDGQIQPQPAYIELDCRTGDLEADYNAEIGNAIPAYHWHGRSVRWSINPSASAHGINQLFEDEDFLADCQAVLDGYEEVWDGSNFVGKYTDEARAIIERYDYQGIGVEEVEIYKVDEWLFNSCVLLDHWNKQTLEDAVDLLECEIDNDTTIIEGDIKGALLEEAQNQFRYNPETLNTRHVETLLAEGWITAADAEEWKGEH